MNSPLLDALLREQAAIQAFIELLQQEAAAMTDGDFKKLPELAQRKAELADQIKALGQQREQQQLALGYADGRSGAAAACAAGGKTLQQAWHNLLTSAAQAHEFNHRNGVMVHTHLEFTRQTISFLQAGGEPLYGPDGTHKAGGAGGNRLALG